MKKKNIFRFKLVPKAILNFILIQLTMILVFILVFSESKPVNFKDTKTVTFTVEATDYYRAFNEHRFCIYSESEKFIFTPPGKFGSTDYSCSELLENISKGDMITLIYYEESGFFREKNHVIDARTKTEVFRTTDNYFAGYKGVSAIVIMVFIIGEMIFWGIFYLYLRFRKT